MRLIKILIIDKSPVVRRVLSHYFSTEPKIAVLGAVPTAEQGSACMTHNTPNLIILNVDSGEDPNLEFLSNVFAHRPVRSIVRSPDTSIGHAAALDALALGAAEVFVSPEEGLDAWLQEHRTRMLWTARKLVDVRLQRPAPLTSVTYPSRAPPQTPEASVHLVSIGLSTGGVPTLLQVLPKLPADAPPTAIALPLPGGCTRMLARRLNAECEIEVREAQSGDPLTQGVVLLAPGDKHMHINGGAHHAQVEVGSGPSVSDHRPSCDVLFESAARALGAHSMGIIMTGMGKDGARGLRSIRDAGGRTLGQDGQSSWIFGMAKEAMDIKAVEELLPLNLLVGRIMALCQSRT